MATSTGAKVVPDASPVAAGSSGAPVLADPAVASINACTRCLGVDERKGEASNILSIELELSRAPAECEQEGDATIKSKVGEAEERVLASSRCVDATGKDEAIAFSPSLDDGVDIFDTKLGGEHRAMRGVPRSVLVEDVVDRSKSAGESWLWSVRALDGGGACGQTLAESSLSNQSESDALVAFLETISYSLDKTAQSRLTQELQLQRKRRRRRGGERPR